MFISDSRAVDGTSADVVGLENPNGTLTADEKRPKKIIYEVVV
jgi:hypothetical protein